MICSISTTLDAMLWALDEVANVAPLRKLPGIVSEAGGHGLQVLACFQDLSQARARWGAAADGFLSLFGTKVVSGIGAKATRAGSRRPPARSPPIVLRGGC